MTNAELRKEMAKPHCKICGRPVDLRRKGAYKMSEHTTIGLPINPGYRFICSEKCHKEWRNID